jgi:ELWxxDGT repeat protein
VKVHDIFADEQSSQPSNLTNVNGTLFFFADDGAHGRELWKSNGTSAGTALVKDARPGPSANYVASTPTALNGKLIYSQVDSTTYENSVWVSDGSVTGTHKLANTGGKYDNAARYFTTVGANVFFFASDTDEANWNKLHTLWKTDGTTVGTRRIKHFEDVNLFPWNVMNFRGSLYFTLFDGGNETLWKSDGTSATTKLTGLSASRIVPFKNQLLINQSGKGLYFSDGNALVGNEIRDLSVTNESSNPTALQNIDGTLYFTAAPTGAVAGKTFQINRSGGEIQPALNWPINPERNKRAIQFGGNYFEANSNTLSRADTPTAEREIVFDGVNGRITHLQATNTHIFFCFEPLGVLDENAKVQLWVSDGTRAGTKLLQSFHKIIWNSDLQVVNNRLLFSVFTTSTQCNLWTSDGTSIGTKLVKDIRPGAITLANVVHPMDTVANIHYFTNVYKIGDVKHTELWRSNGTAAGTIKLATLGAEKNEVRILDSIAFQSKLLFRISGPNRPYMITDGTAVGTQRIQNSQFHEFQSIDLLRASNTAFYFAGTDYGGRYGLWKSNGTPAGTVLIKEVDFNEFRISNIVVNHSQITFSLESTTQNDLGVAKQELWSTNGTLAGTFHVGTFDYLKFSDDGILGKNLYFAASNGKGNVELWTTDGTILGTKRLKDIREGMYASFPMEFIAVGNTMYFTADSRTHGRELWKIVDSDLAS